MENSEKLIGFGTGPVGPAVASDLINPSILKGASGPSNPTSDKVQDFKIPG